MPLDPMIANPATLKLDNPMEQYGLFLKNAMMADEMGVAQQKRQKTAAYNAMMPEVTNNKGEIDWGKARYLAAQRGLGDLVTDLETEQLKGSKTRAEVGHLDAQSTQQKAAAAKAEMDAVAEAVKNHFGNLSMIPYNPQNPAASADAFDAWLEQGVADPIIGKFKLMQAGNDPAKLADTIAREKAIGRAHAESGTFGNFIYGIQGGLDKLAQRDTSQVDTGKSKLTVSTQKNSLGTPTSDVVRTDAVDAAAMKARGGGVNINLPGAKTYAETVTEETAKRDVAAGATNAALPNVFADLDDLENLVDKAYTGYWANGKYNLNAAVGTSPEAVQATQQMNQLLSTDMLKNIGTLRTQYDVKLGSVTEKEFDQLRKTTPSMTDSPETIKKWVQKARAIAQRTQADYERLVTRRQGNPITAPVSSLLQPPTPPRAPENPSGVFTDSDGDPIPAADIENLRKNKNNPKHRKMFDDAYKKPGLSTLILDGGGPTGRAPLP